FNAVKFHDALEWRRRAWHLLDDAGFRPLGDRLLQSYWTDAFFVNLAAHAGAQALAEFFANFRAVFRETGVAPVGPATPRLARALFALFLEGRDEGAGALMGHGGTGKAPPPARPGHGASSRAPLRVATLCSTDHGGAGTGSRRRVEALRARGLDALLYSL